MEAYAYEGRSRKLDSVIIYLARAKFNSSAGKTTTSRTVEKNKFLSKIRAGTDDGVRERDTEKK